MEQIINIIGTFPVWVTAGILLFIVFSSLKEGANAARESHSYDEEPHADPAYREYLEQFDDGDYYSDERGDGGLISIAILVVCSAICLGGFLAGYATNATVGWLIAAFGLAICAYDEGKRGTRQRLNRFARLRAEADEHEQYEAARVAEEKLV